MAPHGEISGQGRRAVLAVCALGLTSLVIYTIFASGFGRVHRTALRPPPVEILQPVQPVPAAPVVPAPGQAGPVRRAPATLAVVSDRFWLTYLPTGLRRTGGGAVPPTPGDEGWWAGYASARGTVKAQVEYGTGAADWQTYRGRLALADARSTTVRGKPAVVGKAAGGGRIIAWLERAGTGAWVRVSESLGDELLPIAASARAPVGD
jgi:hypothetical protein